MKWDSGIKKNTYYLNFSDSEIAKNIQLQLKKYNPITIATSGFSKGRGFFATLRFDGMSYLQMKEVEDIVDGLYPGCKDGCRVAVLTVDIRNWSDTALNNPQQAKKMLDRFHFIVQDETAKMEGFIHKIEADKSMVLFDGYWIENPSRYAVAVAYKIFTECSKENMRVGIGVACTNVKRVFLGSNRKVDFTIMGDAPIQAERLQSLALKRLDCPLIITEQVWQELSADKEKFRLIGKEFLKGVGEVDLYGLGDAPAIAKIDRRQDQSPVMSNPPDISRLPTATELVCNTAIKRETGFLYYLNSEGDLVRSPMAVGQNKPDKSKIEVMAKLGVKKEKGYLYYLAGDGNMYRTRMFRASTLIQSGKAKAHLKWDKAEDDKLKEEYARGKTIKELAVAFQRTPLAIECRLAKFGLIDLSPEKKLMMRKK